MASQNLYFLPGSNGNVEFKKGRNITIRRGIKWDMENGNEDVYLVPQNPDGTFNDNTVEKLDNPITIKTKVMPCCKVPFEDLHNEHDPNCRNIDGLVNTLSNAYPGFVKDEIVTVVEFFLDEDFIILLEED